MIRRIMLDFETPSSEKNAGIVQFAAVEFGLPLGSQRRTFNEYCSLDSNVRHGLHISADTMKWWDEQDAALRNKVFSGTEDISDTLVKFHAWCEKEFGDVKQIELWSRGAGFDCEILQHAYYLIHGEYPFDFRLHMCQRTLERLMPRSFVSAVVRQGQKHDALSDANYQADVIDVALRNINWYGLTSRLQMGTTFPC